MWRIQFVGLMTAATEASFLAPIQWGGCLTKNFVLAPAHTSPSTVPAPFQKLIVRDQHDKASPSAVPLFRAKPDQTIAWDAKNLCIEAVGDGIGDVVRLSRCTGNLGQRWDWMPDAHGRDRIRLKDSTRCLTVVDKYGGLSGAAVELSECDSTLRDTWKFEEPIPFPSSRSTIQLAPATTMLHSPIMIFSVVALGLISLISWFVRLQGRTYAISTSRDGMVSSVEAGGVSLSIPLTGPLCDAGGPHATWRAPPEHVPRLLDKTKSTRIRMDRNANPRSRSGKPQMSFEGINNVSEISDKVVSETTQISLIGIDIIGNVLEFVGDVSPKLLILVGPCLLVKFCFSKLRESSDERATYRGWHETVENLDKLTNKRRTWPVMKMSTDFATAFMASAAADTARWLTGQQERTGKIRCPFWRRRAAESIEPFIATARFVAARHKSLELPALFTDEAVGAPKQLHLPREQLMEIIREDLEKRQYYITGRLTRSIFADDCFFDGPDPDMPVRSLRRYADALHGLFDPRSSELELLSLLTREDGCLVAHWRLSGALKLPWRPAFKPFTGCTLYEIDAESGLVVRHTETWSISAVDAFLSVFWPEFGAPPAPPASELFGAFESGAVETELQPFVVQPPLAASRRGAEAAGDTDKGMR